LFLLLVEPNEYIVKSRKNTLDYGARATRKGGFTIVLQILIHYASALMLLGNDLPVRNCFRISLLQTFRKSVLFCVQTGMKAQGV